MLYVHVMQDDNRDFICAILDEITPIRSSVQKFTDPWKAAVYLQGILTLYKSVGIESTDGLKLFMKNVVDGAVLHSEMLADTMDRNVVKARQFAMMYGEK